MKVRYVAGLVAAAAALWLLAACTPAQTRAWVAWHDTDPAAAEAFARQLPPDPPAPTPGDCASYAPLFARYGLPVATFTHIAWRESGCNHRSFVIDSDDSGGGLLGLNLKGALGARWHDWCGLSLANVTDAETNVRCAAAAYRRMGLAPWT